MVTTCCVRGCTSRRTPNSALSFFRFPKVCKGAEGAIQKKRLNQWLANINRKGFQEDRLQHFRVCSLHFIDGKPSYVRDIDHPDWAPSVNLGHSKVTGSPRAKLARYDRAHSKGKGTTTTLAEPQMVAEDWNVNQEELLSKEAECQTDLTGDVILQMEKELALLKEENQSLTKSVQNASFCKESFEGADNKVKFYTGLPNFYILMSLFSYINSKSHLTTRKTVLTRFQQFLCVLIRLRLNLPIQDLAYRFQTSKSTISRIFLGWIDLMHSRMTPMVSWPNRHDLEKTMPMAFKRHFGNKVVSIIDCFEVFIERPSNLEARAQTYSSYKSHNTIKFLISVAPQGVTTFVSKGWGGRVSDKHLTKECGFLDNLREGDVVLADRGFDIADDVGLRCAHVSFTIPAFTKGKKQLSPIEIEETRRIANVRIHVERVIGNVRQKYTILSSTLPPEFVHEKTGQPLNTLDKIAVVCCALTNLSDSVVPFD